MRGRDAGSYLLRGFVALAVPLLIAVGCERETTSPPTRDVQVTAAVAAKAPSGPAVSSANPPYGDQGTTLDVQVLGSGFDASATATWLLNGVANAHVHTNKTTFVSPTQLTANITIDQSAQIALWDVQVALVGGKNGVGSDLFAVTTAQVLSTQPVTFVAGSNNLGDIAGYITNTDNAFIYDDATGFVKLGPHQARAIGPDASIAFGSDGGGNAVEWILHPDGTFAEEILPAAPNSTGRFVTSAARMADGTLLAAGVDGAGTIKNPVNRPVVWRETSGTWLAPVIYQFPAGITSAYAQAVNALGEVGASQPGNLGIIWDSPTTPVLIDGAPTAINSAGTIAVGSKGVGKSQAPAYWWRDPVTHAWQTTGVLLPSTGGAVCGSGSLGARALNDALVVVGSSCNANGKDQATVWHLDFSGASPVVTSTIALSGLNATGASPISEAAGISQTPPYIIGGWALSGGSQLLVRWVISQ
jgi:hypothetical protein